ncbi:MAG: HIG1 domain-containing protein [Caulobacteraceae bacterium]|nr:HIG1 domain-containing protein [Caulobacter sp.]
MLAFLYVLAALSLLVTLATLGLGLYGFARGGELNNRWGNRLMGWRVKTQAISIAVLMLCAWRISQAH